VTHTRFLFPRWTNRLPLVATFSLAGFLVTIIAAVTYYGTNKNTEVGFSPVQPVEYSHKLHAGNLGMDCRYCHNTVERSAFAAVPATQTCMNCHAKVKTDSERLAPVRESYASNQPIEWIRVHNLPDYVYFNHSAHLSAGVGCSTCHGRIDQMERVAQAQPLSMGWCLECHRNPEPNRRDRQDLTRMDWQPGSPGRAIRPVNPPVNCSGCHR
jgi:hypothetical protein